MADYRLIACSFHDELEALATLRQSCDVLFYDSQGARRQVTSRIIDIYARDGADYLKLQDQTTIRLDQLIAVNGKSIQFAGSSDSCSA